MKLEDLKNQSLNDSERKCIENSVQPWAEFRFKMKTYIAESNNIEQLREKILADSDMKWSQIYSEASKRTKNHDVRIEKMIQSCDQYICDVKENGYFRVCGRDMSFELNAGDVFILIGVNDSQPSMANMLSHSWKTTVSGIFQVCGMDLNGTYDVYIENGYVLFERAKN